MGCGGSKQTATDPKGSPNKGNAGKGKNPPPRGKYEVNGSANGSTTTRSDTTVSEATDKGFKRRIRDKLRKATAGNDIEALEIAMEKFEKQHLDDCGDYTKAKERLQFLKLRKDLRDSVRRSHVGVLEKTIAEAKRSQWAGQLSNQIEAAEKKLAHLRELNEYKHDILNMEQTTISEIHSYKKPPTCVHDVMAATYMLLGHPESKLTDWSDIETLLCSVGRDSLIHRVKEFDSNTVDEQTAERVQDILRPHELHAVRQASNGAAAFYVWNNQICEKVERDKAEEEERLRQEELERQKKDQQQQMKDKKIKKKG